MDPEGTKYVFLMQLQAADQSAASAAGGERKEGSLETLCHMS